MKTNNSKEKVRQLQNKLYLTAKKCDSRRFHALYDKVYREDVLFEAWKRVKANKGSSGVDGIKIEDIEGMGTEKYLSEIKAELMSGRYKPSPVKRVMIPKSDGSERPLGIPTVKDRIVQMATKIAIEQVFEADFRDCSYGFRPKRSAKQALEVVRKASNNKGYYVVDADMIFVSASSSVYVFNYNPGWIYVKKMNSWKLIGYIQKGFIERKITSKSKAKLKKPYFKMVYDNTIKNNCKSSNEEKEIYYEQFYL